MTDPARLREAQRYWEHRKASMEATRAFGSETIKALILINGGAIIALLSFVAAADAVDILAQETVPILYRSFFSLLVGLVSAVFGAVCGYWNSNLHLGNSPWPNNLRDYEQSGKRGDWVYSKWINWSMYIGIVCCFISLICFSYGCWCALQFIKIN